MKQVFPKIISAFLLITTLAACGAKTETPAAVPTDAGAGPVVPLPTAQPSDPCANEYFPVKNNATWAYSSTGSPSGPYDFSMTVNNIRPDGFTLLYQSGPDAKKTQEWACKAKGLAATQLGVNNAASVLAFQKFTKLSASNITGMILPPVITPGMEWTHALDIQGVENKPTNPASMTARLTANYKALGMESVTVPAGTFDAMAIEVKTVIDFTVTTQSNVVNLSVNSVYTLWYAPGVGMVKSSGTGKLGGQDYFETIQLVSYTIP